MKKVLLLIIVLLSSAAAVAQEAVEADAWMSVYLSDSDVTTNIRNSPRGKIAMTLSCDAEYMLNLTTPQNGWWKIHDIWQVGDDDKEITLQGSDTGEYWIHYSVIGVGTRNYGGQCLTLRAAPNENAKSVYTFTDEIILCPMDIQGDWVKVKVPNTNIIGWIEAEWLCSNPLTNCC